MAHETVDDVLADLSDYAPDLRNLFMRTFPGTAATAADRKQATQSEADFVDFVTKKNYNVPNTDGFRRLCNAIDSVVGNVNYSKRLNDAAERAKAIPAAEQVAAAALRLSGQTTPAGSLQTTKIESSGPRAGKMVKVCIICAVSDEYAGATRALRAAGGKLETLYSQPDKVPFEQCILGDTVIRVFSLPAMGQAQAVTQRVLEAEQPGWLFMTGICGGKRGEVSLGDLIVADYTFHVDLNEKCYIDGSRKADMRGYAVPDRVIQTVDHFLRDVTAADIHVTTPRPTKSLAFRKDQFLEQLHSGPKTAKEVAAIFDGEQSLFDAATKQLREVWIFNKATKALEPQAWIELITDTYQWQLTAPGLNYVKAKMAGVGKWPTPDPEAPRFHRGEVAVASGVRSDMPRVWHELELHLRKTIGVEMEGVGLYSAAYNSLHNCNFVMVKAVQDYADDAKDDTYRPYGCELAAAWVVELIKRHGVATAHVLMSEPLPEV